MTHLPRDPFAGEPAPGSGYSELADRQGRGGAPRPHPTPRARRRQLRGAIVAAVVLVAATLWGLPVLLAALRA